jgi:hypothetical protein
MWISVLLPYALAGTSKVACMLSLWCPLSRARLSPMHHLGKFELRSQKVQKHKDILSFSTSHLELQFLRKGIPGSPLPHNVRVCTHHILLLLLCLALQDFSFHSRKVAPYTNLSYPLLF